MNDFYLSKSLFMRGMQCYKSLYLHKHHPEQKDKIPPSREALFESGHEVGLLAQKLFPSGITIPYDPDNYDRLVALTEKAIDESQRTIYEATFSFDGVFVRVDILTRGKRGWELYEVKSATGMKDMYQSDVAVQYYVLKGAQLPVSRAFLIHINNQYIREGEIEPQKLFTVMDVTVDVESLQDAVREELKKQKEMLDRTMPAIDIGPYCHDPYDCDFIGYCWKHIPEVSVFSLKGNKKIPFEFYKQGIITLDDAPLDRLSGNQRLQVEAFRAKKNSMDRQAIQGFLDTLHYPLYFLDFETFSPAIPPFDGTRPYQDIPYQYSLHAIESEGAPLKHSEYLAPPGIDPRRRLAEKLIGDIPPNACVLAYVASFEKGVLMSLAGWFPEYRPRIENIIDNLVDLALPFQKRYLYHWQFNGSYSLKIVLPALVPDLTYQGLEIKDGDMAMQAYTKMQTSHDPAEIERIRNALLEYCSLDTLGMVRIVEKLKEMAGK